MKIIYQDTFREIKKGAGRFVSLFLIVALGVAFYAGIRSCSPDMILSADHLYDAYDLMDIRLLSTLGFTEEDVEAVRGVEGVKTVNGMYAYDFLCRLGDLRDAVKVRSCPQEVDRLKIEEGRTIEQVSECLMDAYFFEFHDYEMGDEIELLESKEYELDDTVERRTFRIVGTFTSPEYLSFDLGSTQIGSGKLNALIMVSPEVFKTGYYTQLDVLAEGTKEELAYSPEYIRLTSDLKKRLEQLAPERENARYEEIRNEYETSIADGEKELKEHTEEYEDAKKLIEDQEAKLQAAEMEGKLEAAIFGYDSAVSQDILGKIEDGKKEIEDAKAELEDAKAELDDAAEQLKDARQEMEDLEAPEWYVLDRKYLTEYSSFRSDADRIGNVGKVFPVIFFIVAALVCLTTMTRMVDEERTQIGTLKALGYSKFMIMRKYLVYALLATVSGSIAGALAGSKILPYVIINVYKLMYPNITELLYPYNLEHCIVAGAAALVCILAATFFACTKSLMENPAELMRPVSPRPGRKLLLERIPKFWRKIPFTWKNALRNFVRYKKRLFMTLFGVIGSTALLLVGFGLKDSVNTILFTQFGEIHQYDEEIISTATEGDPEWDALVAHIDEDERFASYRFARQSAVDVTSEHEDDPMECYLFVPKDPQDFDLMIDFRERLSKQKLELTDETVLISEKMSRTLQAGKGDTLEISSDNEKKKTVTIGGIVENYVYHYIYMSPALYQDLYGKAPEYNEILIRNREGVTITEEEFADKYMQEEAVAGVMSVSSLKDKFADKLKSMDSITLVLIICAGALTFVVLYNLNNINISERRRELATLKVLGFYDMELSGYIYRENILITIIGIAAGVFAGFFLNRFVVTTVEVDVVMFGREILTSSYLLSILIAAGFTALVNFLIHFKMKKIDMAASLKSVE